MNNSVAVASKPHIYKVSELTRLIRQEVEREFAGLWVEGEVSNYRLSPSGHAYFTLKDEHSQLRAIIYRPRLRYLSFRLENGMQVLVKGSLTVYEKRGEYQLVVESLEPKGIGALQLAFEQLKRRLAEEGLFAKEHKKPIPLLPQKIGLVTSPRGAAIQDILNIISRRFPNVHIILNPVRVQGAGAAAEIAAAIEEFNRFPDIDILIVGRGGGSLEDLWAFNEEVVARAIFNSRIPIISAVGHEIDYTIADFVADLRAPTPSAAAELVVQQKEALQEKLESLYIRLQWALKGKLEACRNRIQLARQSDPLSNPQRRILEHQQMVDDLQQTLIKEIRRVVEMKKQRAEYLEQRLSGAGILQRIGRLNEKLAQVSQRLKTMGDFCLRQRRAQLASLMGRLDALSPLSVLKRGYSICQKLPDKEVVTAADQVRPQDKVLVRLHQGELSCQVKECNPKPDTL